jgi:hypothetical protein
MGGGSFFTYIYYKQVNKPYKKKYSNVQKTRGFTLAGNENFHTCQQQLADIDGYTSSISSS